MGCPLGLSWDSLGSRCGSLGLPLGLWGQIWIAGHFCSQLLNVFGARCLLLVLWLVFWCFALRVLCFDSVGLPSVVFPVVVARVCIIGIFYRFVPFVIVVVIVVLWFVFFDFHCPLVGVWVRWLIEFVGFLVGCAPLFVCFGWTDGNVL